MATWVLSNEPQDPWQHGYYLRLSDEDDQVYTWSATSTGAKRAIGDLSRQAARKRRDPIVKLMSDSYKHSDFGKVDIPVLKVASWAEDSAPPTAGTLPPPSANVAAFPAREPGSVTITSGRALRDDDIPFMWEGR
jgi:hypothetical protein